MLIVLAGLPASGKSTLARHLKDALPAVLLDKDTLRSFLFADHVDYSGPQNDLVMSIAYQVAGYLHSQCADVRVIIDGRTFCEPYQVAAVKAAARQMQTSLHFIECVCSESSARQRLLADRESHPAQDRDVELYLRRRAIAEPLTEPALRLDTDQLTPEACMARAVEYLQARPAREGDIVVVDAGGTKTRIGHLRAGVPQAHFDTLDSQRFNSHTGADELVAAIEAHSATHELVPVAVVAGLPGILDDEADTITHCNNIPALEGTGLRSTVQRRLACDVHFTQDIMLQVLGEWRCGVARGHDSVIGVYFGTGIGTTWLNGGHPCESPAVCLQAGHIPVAIDGLICPCGNLDCVEAHAGGHTLQALADTHDLAVADLFMQHDNPALQSALERFVRYQAYLLATLVTVASPDLIVIGGGIPLMPGYPRDRLIQTARHHLQKPWPAVRDCFGFAELGPQAPLHGALALLEHAPRRVNAGI